MDDQQRLVQILDVLIDGWCERRALHPLGALLQGYPSLLQLTDDWVSLYRALRNVRGSAPDVLTDTELALVSEALALTWQALKPLGVDSDLLNRAT